MRQWRSGSAGLAGAGPLPARLSAAPSLSARCVDGGPARSPEPGQRLTTAAGLLEILKVCAGRFLAARTTGRRKSHRRGFGFLLNGAAQQYDGQTLDIGSVSDSESD